MKNLRHLPPPLLFISGNQLVCPAPKLDLPGGTHLTENLVGAHFGDYDSYLVLSHFKGHAMEGFGGAIKNISIDLGSQEGKCVIHTGGASHDSPWGGDQTAFTESMAEAGGGRYGIRSG